MNFDAQIMMTTPATHIAFAPRGAGVLCALFYFAREDDAYGWYTGSQHGEYPACFFMLEHFYSIHATALYRTHESDIYGDWFLEFPPIEQKLDRPLPVAEPICHELARLQSAFVRQWLFYRDIPGAEGQVAAYRAAELPLQGVNLRYERLNKLDKGDAVWIFSSHDIDLNVIEYLRSNWQLDYSQR
jgi:hypothetical protein